MKKAVVFAMLAAVTFVFCSCGDDSAEETNPETGSEGLTYSLSDDGESYVCDGLGEATDKALIVGSKHEGLPVTAIGDWAFYGGEFTSVTIPESVTAIGNGAFATCNYITEITLPEGVTEISESAFHSCASLKSVTLGEGVTAIGAMAFENCVALASVNVPEGVSEIGTMAFSGCEKLSSFTVPSAVTKISTCAFFDCKKLYSIIIPASVTTIERSAFYGCTALARVYYGGGEAELEAVTVGDGNDDFEENIYVFSESEPEETENDKINGYWYYTESGRIELWR